MTPFLQGVATTITLLLVGIVVIKVLWNFLLPYGMLRMKERRPISFLPLIEVVPLGLAVLIAWTAGLDDLLAARRIGLIGFGLIFGSYIHLCVVLFLGGVFQGKHNKRPK